MTRKNGGDENTRKLEIIFRHGGSGELSKLKSELEAEKEKSASFHNLERDIETEKKNRKRERFVWIVGAVVVFDVFAFPMVGNSIGITIIGILEFIIIAVLTVSWEIGEALTIINRIFHKKGD